MAHRRGRDQHLLSQGVVVPDRTHLPPFITRYEGQPCGSCGGTGRQVVNDTAGGVSRQYTRPCGGCGGSGRR